ncbi:MAG: ATP-dependent DNA helicase RecG [Actinomycetota bacterium]|nr:ATP-dependent DNA helicase RecG [Actinomycetota bacterium]
MSTPLTRLADTDVTRLRHVGPKKAEALESVGITSVLDLLTHYPRRYIDRTNQVAIAQLVEGGEAMVLGAVRKVTTRRTRQRRTMVEVDLFDGTSYLHATFFNQPWRARQLTEGTDAVLFGKVERFRGRQQMTNPVVDLVGDRTGRIVPVYPQSEKAGLTSWELGEWIAEALRRAPNLVDPLPARWRAEEDLVGRDFALRQVHLPEGMGAARAARRRLAFDELLRLQTVLLMTKRATERDAVGIQHHGDGELVRRLVARLPFDLTRAQAAAIAEIAEDLRSLAPMHRLLQGDVGSGKTLVAVAALLAAVESGTQGALMAPTEVLAEQHFAAVSALLEGFSVPGGQGQLLADRPLHVALLTNRTPAAKRARLFAQLAAGAIDIAVGTHALLAERVAFARLGVVVIDEQHRFGVEQRSALRAKGDGGQGEGTVPDVLVMTATPIPRTAAMTVYGDLDTTVLDELPPGRTPIATTWARGPLEEEGAWAQVRSQVAVGRQAYVVCPLVEESERVQARSATAERDRLVEGTLTGLRVGLLHGQLPAKDKDEVMAAFRAGDLDVLVATTVIEVGVDVPNATVMIIEDADRFGIAQLHQLRGRVGRGCDESWCFLLAETSTADSKARLEALEASTDGFVLAEVDLDLRGEGSILGARQKGMTDLKLASLRHDRELVARARTVAGAILDEDPFLDAHPDLAEEVALFVDPDERDYLFKN